MSRFFTLITSRMPQEAPHDVSGSVLQHDLLTSSIVEAILSLLRRVGGALVLHPPPSLDC